jgi:hypothetical protein
MKKWWGWFTTQSTFVKAGLIFLGVCAVLALGGNIVLAVDGQQPWLTRGDVGFLLVILGGVCFYMSRGWHPERYNMTIGQIYQGYRTGANPRDRMYWAKRVTELLGYVLFGLSFWLIFR